MNLVKEEKSWLEWVLFVLSVALIVTVVGYLGVDGYTDDDRPPDIRITLGVPARSAHGYLVPVSVTNLGDQTAQAVELEVTSQTGKQAEISTLNYDFLASGEVRKGWVGFSAEPSETLSSRVVGYRCE